MPTIVTDNHTHKDTETDKPMAIGKIMQIFLQFKIFNIQKVGQGHRVKFSQLRLLVANVKMYK